MSKVISHTRYTRTECNTILKIFNTTKDSSECTELNLWNVLIKYLKYHTLVNYHIIHEYQLEMTLCLTKGNEWAPISWSVSTSQDKR